MATSLIMSTADHSLENDVPVGIDIPVIDIGKPTHVLVEQIGKACRDFGAFQVVNHGVPENLMAEAIKVIKEFFALPAEDKAKFYDEHGKPSDQFEAIHPKEPKLYVERQENSEGEILFWRDILAHGTHPLNEELRSSWPNKPATYKEVIGKYASEVRKLAIKLLDIICQGLGLPLGYLGKELIQNQTFSNNYYPPNSNPNAILSLPSHCDPNLVTFIQQDVYALQVLNKNGQWIDVQPISNAFVVLLALTFNVITNEEMKGAVHRVVTSQTHDRISVITFFTPSVSTTIEPAKQLLTEKNPSLYRPYKFIEFYGNYLTDHSDCTAGLNPYKI